MIISVASGKGGTGKTLISTSLALALKEYTPVQLLDCDVEEPDDNLFLKGDLTNTASVGIAIPAVDKNLCDNCGLCAQVCRFHALAVLPSDILVLANLCHGCGACTYLCPRKAISERDYPIGSVSSFSQPGLHFVQGRLDVGQAMAPPIIRAAKKSIDYNALVIIDSPPGSSCPVIQSVKDSDFCLLVTEPTPFGLHDLKLAVEMCRALAVPCGVVINRADPAGESATLDFCRQAALPVILKIPLDIEIARAYSQGLTLVEAFPQWKAAFINAFEMIQEFVNARNRSHQR